MADKTVRIIVRGVDEVSGVFDNIGKKIGGRGGIAGALGKVGLVAGGAVVAGVGAAAAATTAFAASGIQKATSLEQQMANIAAVMGKTKDEVAPLNDLILDLGMAPDLKVDTFEAAEAIELLARNGLSMDQIMQGAARSAIQLSNATGGSMAGASDVATDVMAIFNIEAANMSRAVDGITSVVNNSKFSFDDFRLALARGGGAAASAGVDFEDFNVAIAAIAPNFSSGQTAGTGFANLIQRLVPTTDKAAEAMADLGLITEDGRSVFFDAEGNLKSMAEVTGALQQAFAGLSEEQINYFGHTIFGRDAIGALTGLIRTGEQGFRDLQSQMAKTDAADAVATRMDTLAGQMEILRGTIEATAIKVGQRFMPALKEIVKAVQEFVSKHADQFVEFFGKIADGIARLIPWLTDRLPIAIQTTSDFWSNTLQPALREVWAFIRDSVVPILSDLWEFLNENLPVALQFVSDLWNDVFLPVLNDAWSFIQDSVIPAIQRLADVFQEKLSPALGNVSAIFEKYLAVVLNVWRIGQEVFSGLLNFIGGLIDKVSQIDTSSETLQAFGDVWTLIKDSVGAALDVISPSLKRFADNFSKGFAKFEILLPRFAKLWESIKPIVIGAALLIGAAIAGLLGLITGIISGIAEAIEPFLDAWANIIDGTIEIITGFIDFITGLGELIIGILTLNPDLIKDGWRRMVEGIKQIWEGLWTTLEAMTVGSWEIITSFVGGFIDGIIEFFNNLYDALVGGSIVPDLVNRIIFLFGSLKDGALGILNELVTGAIQLGNDLISGLAGAIEGGLGTVTGAIGGLLNSAISTAQDTLQSGSPSKVFMGFGEDIGTGLTAGMRSMMGVVQKEAQGLTSFGNMPTAAATGAMGAGGITNIQIFVEGVNVSRGSTGAANAEDEALIMLIDKIRRALQLQ